jgi:putative acetyltransferase
MRMIGLLGMGITMNSSPCPDGAAYSLRWYEACDAEKLAGLYRRSVLHYGPAAYSAAQVRAWAATVSADKIAERSGDGRLVVVAVDTANNILGWGDLEADGHIDFLYTAPEAGGRGVGSTVLGVLEQHARARSMPRLYVEASVLAQPLFTRRGFVLLRRNELSLRGVAIHNYSMEKRLL